ncbi:hypothetical protein ACFOLJ_23565 [Rugamonas sp. CCM 8940]|uniref:hypothetical protein n=1 Tax=Rugamonas sp. CCM 8940 TaxID=2765359 RepID=UPI0018F360BC|nr:hypothetical protein [Rugamonas sp. CCM 8940]MBJ7312001.1 hypothetical protein [Rugamonas sp. CCM 8940]
MKTVQDTYPVFEANQVLSNLHLNQLFDYLNEQERLTRANLIGVGIACGLTLKLDDASTTLHLAPGCGITTEGYLIIEADPVALTAYRDYNLPLDVDYPLLRDKSQTGHPSYPLWEMFPAGEPDTTPLGSPANFLDNKAVLLFVELKTEGLRNCSPNDCNDRGSQTVVTIRRLLIGVADLAKVIAEGAGAGGGLTTADLEALMAARLNLPDLALPRYDVPSSAPTTSEHVLAAFHAVFHGAQLATNSGLALSAAYQAFKPLLLERYPSDPFAGFGAKFGFLDNAFGTAAQIVFLQYYYDLFDDLLRAYDEMRWKGVELICACVPSELLFPRHLMLGVPRPIGINAALYRNGFTPACHGDQLVDEFLLLFGRLVGMLGSFTHQPPLPSQDGDSALDQQIRITPSTLGCGPLEHKALPYYYRVDLAPPLYQLWSPTRSRRGRANQSLGYRSVEYVPAAPAFVSEPLRFDLEPHNFLRIEGHLGKQFQSVLTTLLTLKTRHRLPFQVIALRTGAFDENVALLAGDTARFPDLEAMYDVLREELLTNLTEGIRFLYNVAANTALPAGVPKHPLLKLRAPKFVYDANTVGAWYEKYLAGFLARPYIDVDQNQIDPNAVLIVYCALFSGTVGLPGEFFAHAVSIYYMSKLAETLPASLDVLAFADFENKCQDLLGLTHFFRDQQSAAVSADLQQFMPKEELIDHFDQVLYGANLGAMRAVHDEFLARMRQLKQQQVLAFFLQKHPGIQHKAGVPLGGTFLLVYHEAVATQGGIGTALPVLNQAVAAPRGKRRAAGKTALAAVDGGASAASDASTASAASAAGNAAADAARNASGFNKEALSRALKRIGGDIRYAQDADVQALIGSLAAGTGTIFFPGVIGQVSDPIADAVKALADGVVIADFFLPYLCCSDGPCVQYVLPLPPLGLTITLGCTDANGVALATLTPAGGMAPISYQLDGQPFKALTPTVALSVGEHTLAIRDSAGAESAQQTVAVPSTLRLGEADFIDDVTNMTYQVGLAISGGVMPYLTDFGTININQYISPPVPSGETAMVAVRDSAGCSVMRDYSHVVVAPCDLPCKGIARRAGYRFWLPEEDPQHPFRAFRLAVQAFNFDFRNGQVVDLGADVQHIFEATTVDDLNKNYEAVVRGWIQRINELTAKAIGNADWLLLDYDNALELPALRIEGFDCLGFNIQIASEFSRPNQQGGLVFQYAPVGTTINIAEGTVQVPAFNPSHIDKCDPSRPVTPVCGPLDIGLNFDLNAGDGEVNLDVGVSSDVELVSFTWEVQDCSPSIVSGRSATVFIVSNEPPVKNVRLCVYTKEGCMVVRFGQVNVGGSS